MRLFKQKLYFHIHTLTLAAVLAITLGTAVSVFLPSEVLSAGPFVQCGNQDGGTPESGCQVSDLFSTVARIINYLFAGAGVIAVAGVIFGGIKMITSAGNESAITAGKTAIKNSLIGLAIVLLSIIAVQAVLRVFKYEGDPNQVITNPAEYFQSGGSSAPPPPQ